MQAIRQAVNHILETSFKKGDAKLGEEQLGTVVHLAELQFQEIQKLKKALQEMKEKLEARGPGEVNPGPG